MVLGDLVFRSLWGVWERHEGNGNCWLLGFEGLGLSFRACLGNWGRGVWELLRIKLGNMWALPQEGPFPSQPRARNGSNDCTLDEGQLEPLGIPKILENLRHEIPNVVQESSLSTEVALVPYKRNIQKATATPFHGKSRCRFRRQDHAVAE